MSIATGYIGWPRTVAKETSSLHFAVDTIAGLIADFITPLLPYFNMAFLAISTNVVRSNLVKEL